MEGSIIHDETYGQIREEMEVLFSQICKTEEEEDDKGLALIHLLEEKHSDICKVTPENTWYKGSYCAVCSQMRVWFSKDLSFFEVHFGYVYKFRLERACNSRVDELAEYLMAVNERIPSCLERLKEASDRDIRNFRKSEKLKELNESIYDWFRNGGKGQHGIFWLRRGSEEVGLKMEFLNIVCDFLFQDLGKKSWVSCYTMDEIRYRMDAEELEAEFDEFCAGFEQLIESVKARISREDEKERQARIREHQIRLTELRLRALLEESGLEGTEFRIVDTAYETYQVHVEVPLYDGIEIVGRFSNCADVVEKVSLFKEMMPTVLKLRALKAGGKALGGLDDGQGNQLSKYPKNKYKQELNRFISLHSDVFLMERYIWAKLIAGSLSSRRRHNRKR